MVTEAFFVESPVPYSEAVREQERLVSLRIADEGRDAVLFLEHLPVITIGRNGDRTYLLASPEELTADGIELVQSSRGGNITCHSPGQLVVYPVMKLTGDAADVHSYVASLEEVAIRTAAAFGVTAFRREGMHGAWTEHGKIAATGVRLKHWVTSHGMSFNVDPDPAIYDKIVACGLEGERIASLRALVGDSCPAVAAVRGEMARHFSEVFGRELETTTVQSLGIRQS